MSNLPRPQHGEHADYYTRYVDLVPDGDIVEILGSQMGETLALLQAVSAERETFSYAPGKWTVREVIGHLIDVERMFVFRAMNMTRADGVELPGMDPDEWARNSNAGRRPLDDLAAEWASLRRAHVHLFATLSPDAGERRGVASGMEFTVRSFPWIIAGHELWHRECLIRDYGVTAAG